MLGLVATIKLVLEHLLVGKILVHHLRLVEVHICISHVHVASNCASLYLLRDLHPCDLIRIHLLNAGLFTVHALAGSPLELRSSIHEVLLLHPLSLGHRLPHLLLRHALHRAGGSTLHPERPRTIILDGE